MHKLNLALEETRPKQTWLTLDWILSMFGSTKGLDTCAQRCFIHEYCWSLHCFTVVCSAASGFVPREPHAHDVLHWTRALACLAAVIPRRRASFRLDVQNRTYNTLEAWIVAFASDVANFSSQDLSLTLHSCATRSLLHIYSDLTVRSKRLFYSLKQSLSFVAVGFVAVDCQFENRNSQEQFMFIFNDCWELQFVCQWSKFWQH